jgi:hypothetical protein
VLSSVPLELALTARLDGTEGDERVGPRYRFEADAEAAMQLEV